MQKIYRSLTLALLIILPFTVVSAVPLGWQAGREILTDAQHPYYTFYLTANVYRHAKSDLSDLRIVDRYNDFIPYFLQSASTRTIRLQKVVDHKENNTNITLTNIDRLKISSIKLTIPENHQRHYRILEDGRQITSGELTKLQLQDTNINRTTIQLPRPTNAAIIVIQIDNRDDRPLTIEDVRVDYKLDKVVFENTDSGPYTLYYGNPQAPKPSYDIERFRNHIENEPQDIVTLGKQVLFPAPDEEDPPRLDLLFNIVIVIVSLFLVLLLGRQLSHKKHQ
jgi:hypothetical protein